MENKYVCNLCTRQFASEKALRGHTRVHSKKYKSGLKKSHDMRTRNIITKYNLTPRTCEHCLCIIPYDRVRKNHIIRFCSHSCSASHNNEKRPKRSEESRLKTSRVLKGKIRPSQSTKQLEEHGRKNKVNKKVEVVGPYTKIYCCVCRVCKTQFISLSNVRRCKQHPSTLHQRKSDYVRKGLDKKNIWGIYTKVCHCTCGHCNVFFFCNTQVWYCLEHSNLYKNNNRNRYAFTFSIKTYSSLFPEQSLYLLKQYGMWSYTNTNGITRDHKVSVNEAIKNNYDPYYIKHPLNCELMTWTENNEKKTNSSISYSELVTLVDDYENKRGAINTSL